MNFWRTFGIRTVSAIESILEKDKFTLEELLDEDELLQEVRSENQALIDYLILPGTLERLFDLITTEPDPNADSVRKFKYPFLACEILCSDVWPLVEAIANQPQLFERLYRFLSRPPPLNPALSSHVSKVAGSLLEKKGLESLQYLRSRPELVDNFIGHLSSSAVMDLLLKIISSDSDGGVTLKWLCSSNLIGKLIDKFQPSDSSDVHEHAAQALSDIVQVSVLNRQSPLMTELESKPVIEALLGYMFAPGNGSALYYGLDVMTELVARNVSDAWNTDQDPPAALQVILSKLPMFVDILRKNGPPHPTTMGMRVPLGFLRLKVVQFCTPLFATNYAKVESVLTESELFPVVLDLFFEYEWNNFLHQLVEHLVATVFTGTQSSSSLRSVLVERFHLASRLASEADSAGKRFESGGLRTGHYGFIILLGQHITESAQDPSLRALLDAQPGWTAFVSGPLEDALRQPPIAAEAVSGAKNAESDSDDDGLTVWTQPPDLAGRRGLRGSMETLLQSPSSPYGKPIPPPRNVGPASLWQGQSSSEEEEDEDEERDSDESDMDEELDMAAKAALEELKQLGLRSKEPVEHPQYAASYVPPLVQTNVIDNEEAHRMDTEAMKEHSSEEGEEEEENEKGEDKVEDDDVQVATPPRAVDPLMQRMQEVGNQYGTPPQAHRKVDE